jgi:hypothetical protein
MLMKPCAAKSFRLLQLCLEFCSKQQGVPPNAVVVLADSPPARPRSQSVPYNARAAAPPASASTCSDAPAAPSPRSTSSAAASSAAPWPWRRALGATTSCARERQRAGGEQAAFSRLAQAASAGCPCHQHEAQQRRALARVSVEPQQQRRATQRSNAASSGSAAAAPPCSLRPACCLERRRSGQLRVAGAGLGCKRCDTRTHAPRPVASGERARLPRR